MSDQIYRQQIIDHYKNPRNAGTMDTYDSKVKKYNYSCGDEIEVYLKIDGSKLTDVKFDSRGCAIAVASASLLSEEIIGMELEEIMKLDAEFIQELLGTKLTSSRIKCAMLGLEAVKAAISQR